MKDFFISHNSKDESLAEWIAWTLEEAGHSVVIQAWDFRPGGDFVQEMQNSATGTARTIAVLSENYLNAEYTQPEWGSAFACDPQGNERTLVPVRISPCRPTGLLATRIYVDLVGLSEDSACELLLESLQDRGHPTAPSTFPGREDEILIGGGTSEDSKQTFPGKASSALAVWREKLEFLRQQEATASDPAQRFALRKQIEEAEKKIGELGAGFA